MIPLNATEAADILRCREAEVTRCCAQMDHWGKLQELERKRLNRLLAEIEYLQAMVSTSDDRRGVEPSVSRSTPNER